MMVLIRERLGRSNAVFIFSLCVALWSFAFPSKIIAEETQTTEVEGIIAQLVKLHTSLKGMTLTMKGAIGTFMTDTVYFENDFGRFPVQFDAGRSARKKIEDCELGFGDWKSSRCIYEIDAELAIVEPFSLASGGEIKLIVYDLRE